MISGLDATIVIVPPRIALKPIGMTSLDIGNRVREEMRETTGRINATAPMFCMNDEMIATVPDNSATMRFSVLPPNRKITQATRSMAPVLSRPPPRIITPMMEITALLENPEKITSGVSNCLSPGTNINRPKRVMISIAATSTRSNSVAKMNMANATISMTITISVVSVGSASIATVYKGRAGRVGFESQVSQVFHLICSSYRSSVTPRSLA